MDKFTTQELTIEIIEEVAAHKVFVVRINGKQTIMGHHQLQFLRGYAKEEETNE